MPDITMCKGEDCPLKESCYRYKATPDPIYQSYFTVIPFNSEEKSCDTYWEIKTKN